MYRILSAFCYCVCHLLPNTAWSLRGWPPACSFPLRSPSEEHGWRALRGTWEWSGPHVGSGGCGALKEGEQGTFSLKLLSPVGFTFLQRTWRDMCSKHLQCDRICPGDFTCFTQRVYLSRRVHRTCSTDASTVEGAEPGGEPGWRGGQGWG